MKEQDKISGENLNEMEISNLPDKKFKVMVTKLRKRTDEHRTTSTTRGQIRQYQREVTEQKFKTQLKDIREGFSRLEMKERISELKDDNGMSPSEQQKEKSNFKRMAIA